jgi:NitT/TauT family transport system permease protein
MPAAPLAAPSAVRSAQAGVGLLALMALWCALTYLKIVPSFVLATPDQVFQALLVNVQRTRFWFDIAVSVGRIGAGFLSALLVAVALSYFMTLSPLFSRIIIPPISFIRYLPVPALIPFLILWLGIGEIQKISVVFVGVFFQFVLMVLDSLTAVPEDMRDVARSMGATKREVVSTVIFPSALPALYDSARVTLAWAWGWVMLAELVGADSGLGYMLVRAQRFLLSADMLLALFIIGLLGLLMDILMGAIRPRLFRWQ